MLLGGKELHRFLQGATVFADVRPRLCSSLTGRRADGAGLLSPHLAHLVPKPLVHGEKQKHLFEVGREAAGVASDEGGLGDELKVGVAGAETEPRNPVQQWAERARLLELWEGAADDPAGQLHLHPQLAPDLHHVLHDGRGLSRTVEGMWQGRVKALNLGAEEPTTLLACGGQLPQLTRCHVSRVR